LHTNNQIIYLFLTKIVHSFFYFYFIIAVGTGFFVLFTINGCLNKSLHFGL